MIYQFEITPYEFGTWMQPVASFAAMEYLGTNMIDGKPVNNSACVKGFDRVE
jgi:lysophospholipase